MDELLVSQNSRINKTIVALRHRNYRIYWVGLWGGTLGWQILYVTQGWLVYELTGSAIYLGLVGLATATPTVLLSPIGGLLADRADRRKLMIGTQVCWGILAFTLASLTATKLITAWHVLVIAFLAGVANALDNPTRQALLPRLVGKKDLLNAIALSSSVWQSSRIVGPSIAGIIIGITGVAVCFYIASVGYLGMVVAIGMLQLGPTTRVLQRESMMRNLSQGIRFVAERPLFRTVIGITFINSIFGMSYSILMPVFARDILTVGSVGYGFLMGAAGVGAVAGSITLASLGDFRYRGRLLWIASTSFGISLILFASSPWYVFSLTTLFLGGFMNSVYMTIANSSLQENVPDELRGRVMGIYALTYSLVPLGGLQAGVVAEHFGAPVAVGLGGLVVIVCALGFATRTLEIGKLDWK